MRSYIVETHDAKIQALMEALKEFAPKDVRQTDYDLSVDFGYSADWLAEFVEKGNNEFLKDEIKQHGKEVVARTIFAMIEDSCEPLEGLSVSDISRFLEDRKTYEIYSDYGSEFRASMDREMVETIQPEMGKASAMLQTFIAGEVVSQQDYEAAIAENRWLKAKLYQTEKLMKKNSKGQSR